MEVVDILCVLLRTLHHKIDGRGPLKRTTSLLVVGYSKTPIYFLSLLEMKAVRK